MKPGRGQEVACRASMEGHAGWSDGPVLGGHVERLKDVMENWQILMTVN